MRLLRLRFALAAAVLCAATIAPLNAQLRPPVITGPGPGIRGAPPDQTQGITVSAGASVRVAATSARVLLMLSTRNNALTLDSQTVAPVIDALVQSGVDRSAIILPLQFQSPGKFNNAEISATMQNPTVEKVQHGIVTVLSTISTMPGVFLNNAQIDLKTEDCASFQDQARKMAIDEAHTKALATARQLGVHLGTLVAVRVNDQQSQDSSCTSSYPAGIYSSPLQTPQDYITINVYSYVTITYAIR